MSGKIIEFRRPHDLRSEGRHRAFAVPGFPVRQAGLNQQLARISGLLRELEDLTSRFAASGPDEKSEDDPQPDVDCRLLDRMYRVLDRQACAAMPAPRSLGDADSAHAGVPATCHAVRHGSGFA